MRLFYQSEGESEIFPPLTNQKETGELGKEEVRI